MRHKMLSVTYNWNNEKVIVKYSKEFESYDYVQKIDGLQDVIWELQQMCEKERELGAIAWEERRQAIKAQKESA